MKTIAQALTFKDIAVIRGALLDDIARTDLPIDTEPMKEALLKIDNTIDGYCRSRRNSAFALLPLLAEKGKE